MVKIQMTVTGTGYAPMAGGPVFRPRHGITRPAPTVIEALVRA